MINLFEDYQANKAMLEADLFWLNERAKLNRCNLDSSTLSYGTCLQSFEVVTEFSNDPVFERILKRATELYRQIFFVEWAIKTRSGDEAEVLRGLFIDGESWSDLGARLFLSPSSISRLRKLAFEGIKREAKAMGTWEDVFAFSVCSEMAMGNSVWK